MEQCERAQLVDAIRGADVAVPLMSRLDAQARPRACTGACLPLQPNCPRAASPSSSTDANTTIHDLIHLALQLLRSAERLKLVIQYGVGVEGVDIPTVRRTVPLAGLAGRALCWCSHPLYWCMLG